MRPSLLDQIAEMKKALTAYRAVGWANKGWFVTRSEYPADLNNPMTEQDAKDLAKAYNLRLIIEVMIDGGLDLRVYMAAFPSTPL